MKLNGTSINGKSNGLEEKEEESSFEQKAIFALPRKANININEIKTKKFDAILKAAMK